MFHTDIYIRKTGSSKERKIHAHYNYVSEWVQAVREAVTRIGNEEKNRGPYNVRVEVHDDHNNYSSTADLKMKLTDDFASAYTICKNYT